MLAHAHGVGSSQPDNDERVTGSRGPLVPRAARRLWPAGVLAVGAVFAVALLAPEPARGIPVGPLGPFDPNLYAQYFEVCVDRLPDGVCAGAHLPEPRASHEANALALDCPPARLRARWRRLALRELAEPCAAQLA